MLKKFGRFRARSCSAAPSGLVRCRRTRTLYSFRYSGGVLCNANSKTGGSHAVSDHRIDIARRYRLQPGGDCAKPAARVGDRANRHRRHQAADRDRCAASLRRRERRARAGSEKRRRESRRRHLPALGIDRSLARRRNQDDQRRGGAVHRRRQERGAQGRRQCAVDVPPLLPCAGCRRRQAGRDGCRPS